MEQGFCFIGSRSFNQARAVQQRLQGISALGSVFEAGSLAKGPLATKGSTGKERNKSGRGSPTRWARTPCKRLEDVFWLLFRGPWRCDSEKVVVVVEPQLHLPIRRSALSDSLVEGSDFACSVSRLNLCSDHQLPGSPIFRQVILAGLHLDSGA